MAYKEGTIKLAYAGLTLSLERFTDASFPREIITPPEATFSARGTPALKANAFDEKHIWNLTFLLTETEKQTLDIMWRYFLRNDTEVILHDYTEEIQEPTTRSRGLADDALETAIATPANWTRYYAKFQGFFTSPPKYTRTGAISPQPTTVCTLQITETTKTSPT